MCVTILISVLQNTSKHKPRLKKEEIKISLVVRWLEATVRTGPGTTDWFQIGKGVHQGCILSPYSFILYAEYFKQNYGLDEAQAAIKTTGRNINNLRYTDDTSLMAESEEELKSLLMKVKEENEKVGLKLTFRKRSSWHPVPSVRGK